jgi:hypothetical protein
MKAGCTAYDTIQEVKSFKELDSTSHCVVELNWREEPTIDLLFVLSICFAIRNDKQADRYTLQCYNCYFLSWAIIVITMRKSAVCGAVLNTAVKCPVAGVRNVLRGGVAKAVREVWALELAELEQELVQELVQKLVQVRVQERVQVRVQVRELVRKLERTLERGLERGLPIAQAMEQAMEQAMARAQAMARVQAMARGLATGRGLPRARERALGQSLERARALGRKLGRKLELNLDLRVEWAHGLGQIPLALALGMPQIRKVEEVLYRQVVFVGHIAI